MIEASHYMENEYTGPTEGIVLVHVRIISKDVKDNIPARRIETEEGIKYVKRIIPSVVLRAGCDGPCCYPEGPDLTIRTEEKDNGDLHILYVVNFDHEYNDDELEREGL